MDETSKPATFSIVIMGSRGSGKNTFIKAVSEIEVVNRIKDNNDPTLEILGVNMDFGLITIEDETVILYLFGIRLDFMLVTLTAAPMTTMLGFILMVDSRSPEVFLEARARFHTIVKYDPLPCIVVANFQDSTDAWDVDALRVGLAIPNEIQIIPCVATDRDSVKAVIIALLEEVLKDIEAVSDD